MRTFECMEEGSRSIGYLAQRALNFCQKHHVVVKSYEIQNANLQVFLRCNYHPFGQQPDVTGKLRDMEQSVLEPKE